MPVIEKKCVKQAWHTKAVTEEPLDPTTAGIFHLNVRALATELELRHHQRGPWTVGFANHTFLSFFFFFLRSSTLL